MKNQFGGDQIMWDVGTMLEMVEKGGMLEMVEKGGSICMTMLMMVWLV